MNKFIKQSKFQNFKNMTITDKLLSVFFTILSVLLLLIFVAPIIYICTSSISTISSRYFLDLFPTKIHLDGYISIFEDITILRALVNSIVYTIVGVIVSTTMTVFCAYPLSISDFFTGKYMANFLIFTLYFNGGMIPTYLLVKSLGLLDSMWALILPSCISVNSIMLLTASFQKNNSKELFAAASLEGCGHWRYLFKILIPLSKPTILMIAFYSAVSYWNSYFEALIYISDSDKWPLSLVLRNILIENQELISSSNINNSLISFAEKAELIEYALIVISSAPMLIMSIWINKESGVNKKQKNMRGIVYE